MNMETVIDSGVPLVFDVDEKVAAASKTYGLSSEQRKGFLEKLAACWSPTAAARSIGRTRARMMQIRERDPGFAKQWDDAIEQSVDTLEDQAINRAMSRSDTLMIFMLKALRPHKYGDKLSVTNNVSITVQKAREELANVPKEQLLESLAALEAPVIDNDPQPEE